MKMTFKKELVMTSEERETIQKIMDILHEDYELNCIDDRFDVLTYIADENYEALKNEHNYYVEIRG